MTSTNLFAVILALLFAGTVIGMLEFARRDRKRVVLDAPVASPNFTREDIKKAMAFPLRLPPRTLEPWEIDLMNTFKEMEKEVLDLIEAQFSTGSCDDRWLAIARTDLQKGFMALQRAIAKPDMTRVTVAKAKEERTLRNVDVTHNEDGDITSVKEPSLGAQVRKLGLTGEGEGNYD